MATSSDHGMSTRAVHAGNPSPRIEGSAVTPIFQGTVFEDTGAVDYTGIHYPRLSNLPGQKALHKKLAALEGTQDAVAMGSGMAAISTALLTVCAGGGHLLAQDALYGGTLAFLHDDFAAFGLEVDFFNPNEPESWAALVKDNTRAIYTEAICNPTLRVADHRSVVAFAKEHGLVAMIDNTFASPANFQPAQLGYDIVLHSATKYLNGHSDVTAGVVAANEEWTDKIHRMLNHLGGTLDAHACFLLERGIKTLTLRVERQNANALAIAQFLDAHDAIDKVYYPGLPSSIGHATAKDLFSGFGGMVSYEVRGDGAAAAAFIDRLQLPIHAPSLGGVESLVTRPVTTSHLSTHPDERERIGVRDNLVRMSVGIEDVADLISDLEQALA